MVNKRGDFLGPKGAFGLLRRRGASFVPQTDVHRAALWKILSCSCFAAVGGFARALACASQQVLPPSEVAFFQTSLGAFFLWLFWFSRFETKKILHLSTPCLALARSFCFAVGLWLWFTALKYLPLASVAAFKLLSPLIVVLGARLFLKETLGYRRLFAIVGCLLGAFLLFQKDFAQRWSGSFEAAPLAICLPLLALLAFAASSLLGKRIVAQNDPQRATFSLLCFAAPLLGGACFFEWVTPQASHLPALLSMGFISSVAYYSFNNALKYGDLIFLMPFGLTRFIVSALIATFIFGESLGTLTCVGAVLMISVIFLLFRAEAKEEKLLAAKIVFPR